MGLAIGDTPYDGFKGIDLEAEARLPPDMMLPSQWSAQHKASFSKEQKLWMAVLQDGVACATAPPMSRVTRDIARYRNGSYRETARSWIASGDVAPGSFVWVCEALGLEAAIVRGSVLAATKHLKRGRMRIVRSKQITENKPRKTAKQLALEA
jgi:hypothetical protein